MGKIGLLALLSVLTVSFFIQPAPVEALPFYGKVLVSNNTGEGRYSLNERGDVAYVGRDAQGREQIFLWRQGIPLQISNITDANLHFWLDSVKLNNQGQITWSILDYDDGSHGNRNVYLYDGAMVRQLNDNQGQYGGASQHPTLNNKGQVAWAQNFLFQPPHIYLYSGGTPVQLTSGENTYDWPVLNDLGWLVWWGKLAGSESYKIFLYDGSGTRDVTGWGSYDWQSLNNRGWIMYRANSNSIYLYDANTSQATKITNNGETNYTSPPNYFNNDNQVLGACRKYDPERDVIYLYGLAGALQVTDPNTAMYNLANGGWVAYVLA